MTRETITQIELMHRRLERAKRLINQGQIVIVQSAEGQMYLCRSQSDPERVYVVQPESCPCQDRFQWDGHKRCKHILARLILEGEIPLKEIGKNPFYWQKRQTKEQR